jgi:L-threonylcarbamoyladenylate synthase
MTDLVLEAQDLERAAEVMRLGGIVAFPTDTVYGVGALPGNADAVARLFTAKDRPLDKAIPYLISEAGDLALVAHDVSRAAFDLAWSFWPGALTIVVPRLDQGNGLPPTVAVRVPNLGLTRDLIRLAGGVLAVTSANRSGGPNCTTAAEVLAQLSGRIDAILDGGSCPGGTESTVVDASVDPVRVLRVGAVTPDQLRAVVELE